MGDGVAEWTTESISMRTIAGSNLDHGRLFLSGQLQSIERGPTGHGRSLRVLNLKFCQNPKHTCLPTYSNLPYKQTQLMAIVAGL